MTDRQHPRLQIISDAADASADLLAEIQRETGIADPHDPRVQMRMMASAAFILITNEKIPITQRADIGNAWNSFLAADAERQCLERILKVFDEVPAAKKLPFEVTIGLILEKACEHTERRWGILHNLVTVLNPDQEEKPK